VEGQPNESNLSLSGVTLGHQLYFPLVVQALFSVWHVIGKCAAVIIFVFTKLTETHKETLIPMARVHLLVLNKCVYSSNNDGCGQIPVREAVSQILSVEKQT